MYIKGAVNCTYLCAGEEEECLMSMVTGGGRGALLRYLGMRIY